MFQFLQCTPKAFKFLQFDKFYPKIPTLPLIFIFYQKYKKKKLGCKNGQPNFLNFFIKNKKLGAMWEFWD
jgi:hypothetical protein